MLGAGARLLSAHAVREMCGLRVMPPTSGPLGGCLPAQGMGRILELRKEELGASEGPSLILSAPCSLFSLTDCSSW